MTYISLENGVNSLAFGAENTCNTRAGQLPCNHLVSAWMRSTFDVTTYDLILALRSHIFEYSQDFAIRDASESWARGRLEKYKNT